jgi:hypothetical protein
MYLDKKVTIAGRFLRSVRVDQDQDSASLEGYVFPASLQTLLLDFAKNQSENGQGAYTWTGPYGSGKSSLAITLNALLCGDQKKRKQSGSIIGEGFAKSFWEIIHPMKNGWQSISVIGQRQDAHTTLLRALTDKGIAVPEDPSPLDVVNSLVALANKAPNTSNGLIIIIDEMGKFLESAALFQGDVYFFQLLAEAASRSNGRLIVVGILHQAFQEYANSLARESRDEWAKIQGRYIDIPINISGDEQIELVSKAIVHDGPPAYATEIAKVATLFIQSKKPTFNTAMSKSLANAWPLNPLTTILLGPLSKRSYGQNQRSIFSFLASSEAMGFQDFLKNTEVKSKSIFSPADLWDYLLFSLESSISVSNDSHHFSIAKDAIDRCKATSSGSAPIKVLKTIALLELTQQQTGVGASKEALQIALPEFDMKDIEASLEWLEEKSVIIFKRFREVFGLYEGSDFDIEDALHRAYREMPAFNFEAISEALPVSSISAKRHYHTTGSMRWCDLNILPLNQLEDFASKPSLPSGAFGSLVMTLPTEGESDPIIKNTIKKAQSKVSQIDLVVSTSKLAKNMLALIKDRSALEHILATYSEIQRDKIARREINDRKEALTHQIGQEVWRLLDNLDWQLNKNDTRRLTWTGINSLISELADKRFNKTPILQNELLNRDRPSGTANGALKVLLHAVVNNEGVETLGFTKFPAERGLFESLISKSELYAKVSGEWQFRAPKKDNASNLFPLWDAARKYLDEHNDRTIELKELYGLWQGEPYGIKAGVLPLLAVIFMLTEKSKLAYYREGIFLSRFTDLDVDYLLKAPQLIQLRWTDLSVFDKKLISKLAEIANEHSKLPLETPETLDVARALIAAYEHNAAWTKRTGRLSKNALAIRDLFKRSNDPNEFIFKGIPALYKDQADVTTESGVEYIGEHLNQGLEEINRAFSIMLNSLRDTTLKKLQVHSRSPQAYKELNERAQNIKDISGQHRLNAFSNRLAMMDDSQDQMESLAGLAINKPTKNWIDPDIERAEIELASFAQEFNRHETFSSVKGRKENREAIAIVVGHEERSEPYMYEFDILKSDNVLVNGLVVKLEAVLKAETAELDQDIILAALAKISKTLIVNVDRKDKANA